jgi:hypothetical protein
MPLERSKNVKLHTLLPQVDLARVKKALTNGVLAEPRRIAKQTVRAPR